jgi:hypothetical protein
MRQYWQSGAVALLSPGDTTLVDACRPWTSDCSGTCARLYLRVPSWFVQDHFRISSMPVLPRIRGNSGLGATLFRLATSLYEEAEGMSAEEGIVALEAYLDILAGCIARPEAAHTKLGHCAQLQPRVEHFIESHLPEPSLSPHSSPPPQPFLCVTCIEFSQQKAVRLPNGFANGGWNVAVLISPTFICANGTSPRLRSPGGSATRHISAIASSKRSAFLHESSGRMCGNIRTELNQ